MVVVALLSVYLVESVYVVSVDLVVNCTLLLHTICHYGIFLRDKKRRGVASPRQSVCVLILSLAPPPLLHLT